MSTGTLAYTFWHWRQPQIAAADYERAQHAFHAALADAPATGFVRSFRHVVADLPWAAGGVDVYEDWYLVEDFTSLGMLNDAAVSSSRSVPHDAAAGMAAGGAGGLYRLKHGAAATDARYAAWFGKPQGMTYAALLAELAPIVDRSQGALWMRQMVLGPARELCIHSARPLALPASYDALVVPLRAAWG